MRQPLYEARYPFLFVPALMIVLCSMGLQCLKLGYVYHSDYVNIIVYTEEIPHLSNEPRSISSNGIDP